MPRQDSREKTKRSSLMRVYNVGFDFNPSHCLRQRLQNYFIQKGLIICDELIVFSSLAG